jgi:phenylacetate-CoA ligase
MNIVKSYIKHAFRNGRLFRNCLAEIEASEKYTGADLEFYQNQKLRETIKIAYEDVPFYRKIFKERNLTPADIKSSADLYKLPIIDKKIVRDNGADFLNKNVRGPKFSAHTSGTTGTPAIFWRDLKSINFENAVIAMQQKWAGVVSAQKSIWLRGNPIVPIEQKNPPFWQYDLFENQLIMSSYHLSNRTFPYFINKIKEFSPQCLWAYPASAYIVAEYLERVDAYINIPVVITSSEVLFPEWRGLIEKRFNAKVFDYYGMAERVTIGIECNVHQGLHLVPGYGITEAVDHQQVPVNDNEGIMVGTSLNNHVMPLIRYKTDDLVKFYKDDCPCGCKFPRMYPIEARVGDIILTSDGRHLSPTVFRAFIRYAQNVEFLQIIQNEDGSFTVKIVKSMDYCQKDADFITAKMKGIVGRNTRIELEYVEAIPTGKNGKFNLIISNKNKALRQNV